MNFKNSRLLSAVIILITSILLSIGIGFLNHIAGSSSVISYLFTAIPVLISIFYLGASMHLGLIEHKINKEILQECGEIITERMSFINILINRGKDALKNFNSTNITDINYNSRSLHVNVSMLRRIISALEERQDKLIELSRSSDLKEAEELSFAPLIFANSSLHSVDQTVLPDIEHDQWEEALNSIIRNLEYKQAA